MNKSASPDVLEIHTTLSSFSHSDTSFSSAGFHLKRTLVGIRLNVTTTHGVKGQRTLFWTDTLKRPIQLRLTLSVEITLEKGTRSWERNRRWQEKKERFNFVTSPCQITLSSLSRRHQVYRRLKTRRIRNIFFERKAELKGKAKDKFLDGINLFAKKCTARLGHTFRITNVVNCLPNTSTLKKERQVTKTKRNKMRKGKIFPPSKINTIKDRWSIMRSGWHDNSRFTLFSHF